ncbi:hypothetical protein LXL04_036217 [Taraxacum kok-saghyz]
MQNSSTYVRELVAITEAVKKWRHYLLGRKFRIFTDQRSLKHLLTQIVQTPEQQKWATKLLGYDFEIFYKPGKDNHVADALSRMEQPTFLALTATNATWLNDIREFFVTNPAGTALLEKIEGGDTSSPYTFRDGLVYFQGRISSPQTPDRISWVHPRRTRRCCSHNQTPGGCILLAQLKNDVLEHVKECVTCQTVKYPTRKPYGLLQMLPIPSKVWSDISMDFITHLPPSQCKTAIWVIVDRFTKFAHFIALPTHYTAISLATLCDTRQISSFKVKLFL